MAYDIAVALKVVATQNRERTGAVFPARFQGGDDGTERRAGQGGRSGIMLDVGMGAIEAAGYGINVITALGHGE